MGINAYHADASAAILVNGRLVAAVEEERFCRIKHWAGFPSKSILYCLEAAGVSVQDVAHVAVSRNPRAHLFEKALLAVSRGLKPSYVLERVRNLRRIAGTREALAEAFGVAPSALPARFHHVEHHRAHMASSFFVSPFEEAAVLSIDALGDFVSTMHGLGRGNRITIQGETCYPHSLGFFYTAMTQFLGFPNYGDEFKVMGLASYGKPVFAPELRKIVRIDARGRVVLDLAYFRHVKDGISMTWDGGSPTVGPLYAETLTALLGPARRPDEPLTDRHHDLASSLQAIFEECYFALLNRAHQETGLKAVCLSGGCAMNSVANGKIFEKTPFTDIYIQPAAGDAGTAIGAAYYVWNQVLGHPRSFVMTSSSWGAAYSDADAAQAVARHASAASFKVRTLADEDALCRETAGLIADGKVVGWFQGRMEWGARALGNRSIVADPRRAEMKDVLNARIKRRESFRPFAPSILAERVGEYFEINYPDPFMLKVYPVRQEMRAKIPAVTHVDGTGRLQTVDQEANLRYWKLIKAFDALTGVPVILNTSFNENEPIVRTPEEALDCFARTKMDALAIGLTIVEKPV